MIFTGPPEVVGAILQKFDMRYKLGTVAHGPGRLRFYGMNIVQEDDFSSYIDAEDKPAYCKPFLLRYYEVTKSLVHSFTSKRHPLCHLTPHWVVWGSQHRRFVRFMHPICRKFRRKLLLHWSSNPMCSTSGLLEVFKQTLTYHYSA